VALADVGRTPPSPVAPSVLKVGTVVWLASELMFFSGLFAAYYFFLRAVPLASVARIRRPLVEP
jgi:cytochrome c oxidase subunit 3